MAKFKVGDRVVFNCVKGSPTHFSKFNGMEAPIMVVHPAPAPGSPDPQAYNVQFPNEGMHTWVEEPELVHAAMPSNSVAGSPSQPSNSVTPNSKFKLNDRVRIVNTKSSLDGVEGQISEVLGACTYNVKSPGVTIRLVQDDMLELVKSFDSMTLREVADAKIKELEQCGRIAPKIKPRCPACGLADEGNYVGFSTVECMNKGCIHYHGERVSAHG